MEEIELRKRVADQYRIPDVPEAVWKELESESVPYARSTGELEDLFRDAGRLLRVHRAGATGRTSPPGREERAPESQVVPIEVREAEAERGRALSEFLAHQGGEGKDATEVRPITSKVTMSWGGKRPPLYKIVLEVAPWVNAKEVERAYRKTQREVLGKDNRPLSARSIAVFRFVEELLSSTGGTRPSWRKMLALYNERYPKGHKLHFKDADPSNFRRTYNRAHEEIVRCGFNYYFRKRELTPEQKQAAREALEKAEAIVALDEVRQKNRRKT